jgi:NADPH:quinone reductase-like Zn-dependent oxidoreductase
MMLGFSRPKREIPGCVFAGVIEEIGPEVLSFSPGDAVYGIDNKGGAWAEYKKMPENGALALIPESLTFEEAAAVPFGGLTALYFLDKRARVKSGQKVLVRGASGVVGSAAVQMAKHLGAEVTGVCGPGSLDWVLSLGADRVIDYTQTDFAESGERYDIILDTVVGKTSFGHCRKVLNPKGSYLAVAGGLAEMRQSLLTSFSGGQKVVFGGGSDCEKQEALEYLNVLIKAGRFKPAVDRVFSMDQMIEANRHVDRGHKAGNTVVRFMT